MSSPTTRRGSLLLALVFLVISALALVPAGLRMASSEKVVGTVADVVVAECESGRTRNGQVCYRVVAEYVYDGQSYSASLHAPAAGRAEEGDSIDLLVQPSSPEEPSSQAGDAWKIAIGVLTAGISISLVRKAVQSS